MAFWRTHRGDIVFGLLLLALYLIAAPFAEYDDEWDNLIGGKFLSEGRPIYTGFFSHHFPLPYFLSALLHLLPGPEPLSVRFGYNILLWGWLMALYLWLREPANRWLLRGAMVTVALLAPVAWMQMIVAENLISYVLLTFLLVLYCRPKLSQRELCALSALTSIIGLSSVGYIFLTLSCYSVIAVYWYRSEDRSMRGALGIGGATIAPYLLFLGYLLFSRGVEEFLWQAITFNKEYYFKYAGGPTSGDPLGVLLHLVQQISGQIYLLLATNVSGPFGTLYLPLLVFAAVLVCATFFQRGALAMGAVAVLIFFGLSRFGYTQDVANSRNTPLYGAGIVGMWISLLVLFEALRNARWRDLRLWSSLAAVPLACCFFGALVGRVSEVYGDVFSGRRIIALRDHTAEIVDSMIGPDDQYWIGPFDFRPHYFIRAQHVTRYTFFLAWLADSERVTNDLLRSLEKKKPELVIFNHDLVIWNQEPRRYALRVIHYLRANYRRHPTLPYYLIRKGSRLEEAVFPRHKPNPSAH